MDAIKNNWIPVMALLISTGSLLGGIIVSFGAQEAKLDYIAEELAYLREDVRSRTKDRIYASEHRADMAAAHQRIEDVDNRRKDDISNIERLARENTAAQTTRHNELDDEVREGYRQLEERLGRRIDRIEALVFGHDDSGGGRIPRK